jgi:hypothetical protein
MESYKNYFFPSFDVEKKIIRYKWQNNIMFIYIIVKIKYFFIDNCLL